MREGFLWQWLSAYASSGLKFIGGPALGTAFGLNYIEMVLATALGMMTSVLIITFFHQFIKRLIKKIRGNNRKIFTARNRKFVMIWRKYGIYGVAFLTPILLTPIGGTLLAVSFGTPRHKIITTMAFSAFFWAFIVCAFFGQISKYISFEL